MTTRTRITRPRPTKGQAVDFDALDALLDVPVPSWDRNVQRLVREFRTKELRLALPPSRLGESGQPSSRVIWTNLFEAQIKHMPRMERAEEFRMARRYDFQKSRVRDALLRAGHRPALVDELVTRPMHALPAPTRKAAAGAARLLERTVEELEVLRNLYVEGALYLVHGPVRRYTGLGVDEFDLVQESAASLFQAIEGFDWRREVRFKTYAVYWIQQAILKTLYNASRTVRIPIWVQKAYRKIRRAQEANRLDDGLLPDVATLAAAVNMPPERVEEILKVRRYAVSIDAMTGGEDGYSLSQAMPDDAAQPIPDSIPEGDLGTELSDVLADLPDRERMILERRFGLGGGEPETLSEIAKDLGVTAERIRQLQKAAIERLQRPRPMQRLKMFA